MMKVQEPPKLATWSAMRSPKVSCSSMRSLGLRQARPRDDVLGVVDFAGEDGEHVETGHAVWWRAGR